MNILYERIKFLALNKFQNADPNARKFNRLEIFFLKKVPISVKGAIAMVLTGAGHQKT